MHRELDNFEASPFGFDDEFGHGDRTLGIKLDPVPDTTRKEFVGTVNIAHGQTEQTKIP